MLDLTYLFQDQNPAELEVQPSLQGFQVDSGGYKLLALCLKPGGKHGERYPAVLFLHGFPGNEQNRDLAQALRRTGMVSVMFHYRGCWGSQGEYRFSHLTEDTIVMVDYLKAHAEEFSIDPERIYLVGHSMGSFAALTALANGAKVKGTVCLAPCDIATMYLKDRSAFDRLVSNKDVYFRIDSNQVFYDECEAYGEEWTFPNLAGRIDKKVPLLVVGALRDVLVPPAQNAIPLFEALKENGACAEYLELDASHEFDAQRTTLIRLTAEWLERQENRGR